MTRSARDFGESLVARHVLSRDDLEAVLEESARTGTPLPDLLEARGLVGVKDLAAGRAFALGLDFVDLDSIRLRPDLVNLLTDEVALAHRALPIDLVDDRLVVAFADPSDHAGIRAVADAVRRVADLEIDPVGAEPAAMLAALEQSYGSDEAGPTRFVARGIDPLLEELLDLVAERGGSDLHLSAGEPPRIRLLGDLWPIEGYESLSGSRIREMAYSIINHRQIERFEEQLELDASHAIPGKVRLRITLFVQRDSIAAAFRIIPFEVIPYDQLGLPDVVREFSQLPRGLVLVTGPTGSGKSTTLAALIDIINQERPAHIITIEEPIEFVHSSKRALVNQRDVGQDTHSFALALRQALRQDPDVILVGEMRDLETVSTAIAAAETGHLVLATLHTQDTPQTIDRIVDVFPPEQQEQVRTQVAGSLQGVVTQQLVPTAEGGRRVVAAEVMVATPAVRTLIRDGKIHQVHPVVQAGKKHGMVTMDESLGRLVKAGEITLEAALARCRSAEELRRNAGAPAAPDEPALAPRS